MEDGNNKEYVDRKSFKFRQRDILYYNHYIPGMNTPEYLMNIDSQIIHKYMNLGPNDVFLDVGAAFGSWTLPALSQGVSVIAFEPHTVLAMCLNENAVLNSLEDNLVVINRSVWDENNIKIPYNFFTQSSFNNQIEIEPVYITTTTIDSLDLDRIDLIKIDVEGAEKKVINGTQQSIKKYHPIIILENHVNLVGEVEIDGYNKTCLEDGKFLYQ